MATAEELEAIHFNNVVVGLKKKSRALPGRRRTRTSLKDRPRTGLTGTTGAIDEKGGADAPSANQQSSYAARRQPIIPRPHPSGSSPWSPRPAPNGAPVPSDLARHLQQARLARRMSLEALSDALRSAPQPTVLSADQLRAYEDGAELPSRPALQRLAAALEEPSLLRQLSPASRSGSRAGGDSEQPSDAIDRTSSGLDDAKMLELERIIDHQRQVVRECGPPAVPDGDRDAPELAKPSEARVQALKQRAQARIQECEAELQVVSVRVLVGELRDASAPTALRTVRVAHNRIGDVGARLLGGHLPPSITALDLSHNRIASAGLQALCDSACAPGFAALEVLRLSGNRGAFAHIAPGSETSVSWDDAQGALALHRLLSTTTTLRELGLAYCGLTEPALQIIVGLRVDEPSTTAATTPAGAVISSLEALDLSGNQLGSGSASHLLGSILCGQCPQDKRAVTLPKLSKLNMTSTGMGDDGAAAISQALRNGCALTDLSLNSNSIGQDGAAALANAVCKLATETSSQITKLSAASNDFGPNGGIAFAKTLEHAYQAGLDVSSWPKLEKLDLSANKLGYAGERGPQPQPPIDMAAAGRNCTNQLKLEQSTSPPASPAVSPGRRTVATDIGDSVCQPSEHRVAPYNAALVKASQMTADELRESIKQRRQRSATRARGRMQHGCVNGRSRRQHSWATSRTVSKAKPAWGFSRMVNTASIAPQRLDDSVATLCDNENRPAGRALNSYTGPAPMTDCEPPPVADFVSALRGAILALRSSDHPGRGLRAIKIEGNGLGKHSHELLSAISVTFTQPGTIGLELLPDQATAGKNGIEVRSIKRGLLAGATTADGNASEVKGIDQVKVGMLLQSVAGIPIEKAAGSTSQRFRQVIGMIKAAGRPMTLTFIDPADRAGHWYRLLDGWITTEETKSTDQDFRNKFLTAEEADLDTAVWRKRNEQVAEGARVDEARVQRIRHELMARLPPQFGYITPSATTPDGLRAGTTFGWARKSLQQLRQAEQASSRHDGSIASLEAELRAEAELIGSGLRSIDEIPLQYAGKVEGPHRGFHHRFLKDQTDKAAEMLLSGLNKTDVSMTQLPPSRFPKGEGGRFDLLENRARQVARRIAVIEAKSARAGGRKEENNAEQGPEAATGLLKWRDPLTGELHHDQH